MRHRCFGFPWLADLFARCMGYGVVRMSRRPALFTQADLSRALSAMRKSDYDGVVEITPQGSILILPADRLGLAGKTPERAVDEEEPVEL